MANVDVPYPHQSEIGPMIVSTGKIASIVVAANGKLKPVYIRSGTPNPNGPAKFDIRKNDASIFNAPANYLTLGATDTIINTAVGGSNGIDCVIGDVLDVYAMTIPSGGIGSRLSINLTIIASVPDPNGGIPEGGDVDPATGTLDKIKGKEIDFGDFIPGFGDEFPGTTLNTAKWDVTDEIGDGTNPIPDFFHVNEGLFITDTMRMIQKTSANWQDGSFVMFKFENKLRDDDHQLFVQFLLNSGPQLGVVLRSIIVNYGGESVGHGYDETVARWIRFRQDGPNIIFEESTNDGASFTAWKTTPNSNLGAGKLNFRFVNNNSPRHAPFDTVKITHLSSNLGLSDPYSEAFDVVFDPTVGKFVKRKRGDLDSNGKVTKLQGRPLTVDPLAADVEFLLFKTADTDQWQAISIPALKTKLGI